MDMTRTKKHAEDVCCTVHIAYIVNILIGFIVNIYEYGILLNPYCSKTINIISLKLLYVLVNMSEITFHEKCCQGHVIHKVSFKVKY